MDVLNGFRGLRTDYRLSTHLTVYHIYGAGGLVFKEFGISYAGGEAGSCLLWIDDTFGRKHAVLTEPAWEYLAQ